MFDEDNSVFNEDRSVFDEDRSVFDKDRNIMFYEEKCVGKRRVLERVNSGGLIGRINNAQARDSLTYCYRKSLEEPR